MLIGPGLGPAPRTGGGTSSSGGSSSSSGGGSASPGTLADYTPAGPVWSATVQSEAANYYLKGSGTSSVKARGLIILGFLLACAMAFGQSDTMVYVKTFPGVDVGTKVTNAMGDCTTNVNIPCYLIVDATLAVYAPGTLPAMCSHCFLIDYRYGPPGASSINGVNGAITLQSLDPTHLPIGLSGSTFSWNLLNVDKLDQGNTHTTGTQLVVTGSTSKIGRQVQGNGTITAGYINTGSINNGTVNVGSVSAGQMEFVFELNCGSAVTPTSSLGNTFTLATSGGNCPGPQYSVFKSVVTVGGANETISTPGQFFQVVVLSNINTTNPIDVIQGGNFGAAGSHTTDTHSFSITTNYTNDYLFTLMGIEGGSPCTFAAPSGFTQNAVFAGPSYPYQVASLPVVASTTYPLTFTDNCAGSSGGFAFAIAFRTSSTFLQSADLDQYLDANGNVLAHVSGDGGFNPPQFAGVPPVPTGINPGKIAYNTVAHCTEVYDAVNGWQCAQVGGAVTNRTAGTNGFYSIAGDGTITEWVSTGALNNNTPTTITLPHAIPTAVIATVCTDNGSRVQSGNNQPVGANVAGLTAPYSTFIVDSPATGMSASCIVVGY